MWQTFGMGRQNSWNWMKERARDFFILKSGEGIITLTSLTATVMASIIFGTVLSGHIMYVSIDNSQ